MYIEKKITYKPTGWTDQEYHENIGDVRDSDIADEDIVSGRYVPLDTGGIVRRVAFLIMFKPS